MFGRQTLAALAQVLEALAYERQAGLVYKHFNIDRDGFERGLRGTIRLLERAQEENLMALVREVVQARATLRSTVTPRYSFDEPFRDFERWLLHDGWRVEDGEISRLGPAVEDVIEVRDRLYERLAESGLDEDGAIAELLDQSAEAFQDEVPDYNASGTNARVALETVVRRIAEGLAEWRGNDAPRDRWGPALRFLEIVGFLDGDEERAIASLYTFVSDAAHVPLSDEEWARLARAFSLSCCYYLLCKLDVGEGTG